MNNFQQYWGKVYRKARLAPATNLATARPPPPPPQPPVSSAPPAPPPSWPCPMASPTTEVLSSASAPPPRPISHAASPDPDSSRASSPVVGSGEGDLGSDALEEKVPGTSPELLALTTGGTLMEAGAASVAAVGGVGAASPDASIAAVGGVGASRVLLPPPPARLPPDFTPVHISELLPAPAEREWVEVGGRRRPRLQMAPAPLPRKETGLSHAFKQRTFGLCFRCLSPDHFVADCHGPVRCLGCRHSGHRERDCPARFSASQAPDRRSCSPPCRSRDEPGSRSPPSPPRRPQGSWAAVVAPLDAPNLVAGLGEVAADADSPVAGLRPLLAAQAEALSTELQAMFEARLEEVFLPLRELVAAV